MSTLRERIAELEDMVGKAAVLAHEHANRAERAEAEAARLRGLLDELRRPGGWCSHQHITMTRFAEVVAEKLNARAQRDEATNHARKMIAEREQAEATIERVQIALALMRHGLTGDERSLGKLSAIETIEDALADPDDDADLDQPAQ